MKRNDFQEIKNLNIKALVEKIELSKKELADLMMDLRINKLKDTKSPFKKRKDIAQMLTVLRQKQLIGELTVDSEQLTDKKEIKSQKAKVKEGEK